MRSVISKPPGFNALQARCLRYMQVLASDGLHRAGALACSRFA
jgi:hypothetical protein